jgi:hypothetical protein
MADSWGHHSDRPDADPLEYSLGARARASIVRMADTVTE